MSVSEQIDSVDKKFDTKFAGVNFQTKDMELKMENSIESVIEHMGRLRSEVEKCW